MQDDSFPAAEKILSDLETIFKKNLDLFSFEIIPADNVGNKSPVHYDANAIGLASWCVKPLFCYVYNRLFDSKKSVLRRVDTATTTRWLFGALLLNPDISTFWNMRRDLARIGKLDPFEELRYINIVLYHKAKCFEAFSYRYWILNFLINKKAELNINFQLLFQKEMHICAVAAERYKNNCHAWNYRQRVVSMAEKLWNVQFNTLLDNEWEESTKWCKSHVSDCSGLTYRQFLLKKLILRNVCLEEQSQIIKSRKIILDFVDIAKEYYNVLCLKNVSCKEVLNTLHGVNSTKEPNVVFEQSLISISYWMEDCLLNEQLIETFPGHEALWYHRRFLVFFVLAMQESFKEFCFYESLYFNCFQDIKVLFNTNATDIKRSKNVLFTAFSMHNNSLVTKARKLKNYQNKLAENFEKFLLVYKI